MSIRFALAVLKNRKGIRKKEEERGRKIEPNSIASRWISTQSEGGGIDKRAYAVVLLVQWRPKEREKGHVWLI